jgi:hypothetical protein
VAWLGASAAAKAVVAVVGTAVVAGGVAVALRETPDRPSAPAAIAPSPSVTASAYPATSPSRSAAPSAPASPVAARYGSVVDAADPAPPRNRRPRGLPERPEGTLAVSASGDFDARPEVTSMIHRGEWATFRGRGYLRVEWAVAFTQRVGVVAMPSWTGLRAGSSMWRPAAGGGSTTGRPPAAPAWETPPTGTRRCRPVPSRCGDSSTTTSMER